MCYTKMQELRPTCRIEIKLTNLLCLQGLGVSVSALCELFSLLLTSSDTPYIRYRSSDTPYIRNRSSDTPYIRNRSSDTPYIRNRSSDTPYIRERSSDTPFIGYRSSDTPFIRYRSSDTPHLHEVHGRAGEHSLAVCFIL